MVTYVPSGSTITVAMIVKNVEKIIGRCIFSFRDHVHELIVVDTGSSDGTKAVVKETFPAAVILDFNAETHPDAFIVDDKSTWPEVDMPGPFTGKKFLADFGAARQFGWQRAGGDYVMWIDSDDVLVGGEHLKEVVEEMKRDGVDTVLCPYDYAHDGKGNVTCRLTRERITRRGHSKWTQPIHEVMGPTGIGRFNDKVVWRHMRQDDHLPPEVAMRNLKVLLHYMKGRDPENVDPRMLFYLGLEERGIWPEKAAKTFQLYTKKSGWDEERSVAHMYAGYVYESKGQYDEAISEYAVAAVESDFRPEGYFALARCAYFKKDFSKCLEWSEKGFETCKKAEKRQSVLMHDPADRVYRPYVFYSFALVTFQRYKEAIEACEAGLRWNPEDPHLLGNKEFSEKALAAPKEETAKGGLAITFSRIEPLDTPSINLPQDVLTAFAIQFWKRHMEARQHDKAISFLDNLPQSFVDQKRMEAAREFTLKKMSGVVESSPRVAVYDGKKMEIVIWTGPAWEVWSPESISTTGIGGSETAAVCMARELVRIGHSVTVISDCPGDGLHDGVRYVPYRKALENTQAFGSDVMVVSRQAETILGDWNTKAAFLWVHDIHVGSPSPRLAQAFLRYDKVFCLSDWHKQFFLSCYPGLPSDQIKVTRNGIDVDRFAKEPEKKGNRLIYSSSPDRGLEVLLGLLPAIKDKVPDVKLDIFYGFTTWKSMADRSGDEAYKRQANDLEALLKKRTDEGLVNYHGRVNQQVLAEAFLGAKVWGYPTAFTETFCITALEAMAAGCVPVTTSLAALSETVKHGILLQPPNTSEVYRHDFVNAVVGLLTNEPARREKAEAARSYATKSCGWDGVAREWSVMFEEMLDRKADNPLPIASGDL